MHQSIPPAPSPPPPPRADHRPLAFFLPWMANSWGWGLLSCQIPGGGTKKRGQMPRPPSTLQHFSLIEQSNSAILSISIFDFLFQLRSSFVIVLGFQRRARILTILTTSAPVYGFSIDTKLLTLNSIERCKVICFEYFSKYERMFLK